MSLGSGVAAGVGLPAAFCAWILPPNSIPTKTASKMTLALIDARISTSFCLVEASMLSQSRAFMVLRLSTAAEVSPFRLA